MGQALARTSQQTVTNFEDFCRKCKKAGEPVVVDEGKIDWLKRSGLLKKGPLVGEKIVRTGDGEKKKTITFRFGLTKPTGSKPQGEIVTTFEG